MPNSGDYYENTYPLSASLRTEYQNKNPNSVAGSDLFCQRAFIETGRITF
jgi:hypothetical protein